jgi:hypothetical protein
VGLRLYFSIKAALGLQRECHGVGVSFLKNVLPVVICEMFSRSIPTYCNIFKIHSRHVCTLVFAQWHKSRWKFGLALCISSSEFPNKNDGFYVNIAARGSDL